MQKQKDIKFLKYCERKGIAWIHGEGIAFISNKFIPALKRLEKVCKTKMDKEVVADSYYDLGDVYDFNDAPEAAIQAYKRGIKFFPKPNYASGFHREIGVSYGHLGKWKLAVKFLKAAVNINPLDTRAQDDLEFAIDDLKTDSKALFEQDNWEWEINELLAKGNGELALKKLERKRSLRSIQMRSRVYGLLDCPENQLEEWKKLKNINGSIELERADLFFISDALYESQEFWKTYFSLRRKIKKTSIYLLHDDQEKFYGSFSYKKLSEDYLRFKIAVCGKNLKILKKLLKKYPKWKSLNNEILKLERSKPGKS